MSRIRISPLVTVELIGDEILVFIAETQSSVRLSGEAAEVVRQIQRGETVEESSQVVKDLRDLGIVSSGPGMSRRSLVKAGAIGAGVGIATLAMPSVAAASSTVPLFGSYSSSAPETFSLISTSPTADEIDAESPLLTIGPNSSPIGTAPWDSAENHWSPSADLGLTNEVVQATFTLAGVRYSVTFRPPIG